MKKCVADCKHFHGGEILHHEDCPVCPDSISKAYREMKDRLKKYDEQKGNMTVKVGEIEYSTVIDEHGTQRFVKNKLLCHLVDSGQVDLNRLSIDYQHEKFSQREYAEFNMMLGYSVSGFSELSSFDDLEIENPLWESKQ
jgi:tRNA/tmRNA/rRNA uracil-C5-methylase (TrmA/RlmC/RlmD family)